MRGMTPAGARLPIQPPPPRHRPAMAQSSGAAVDRDGLVRALDDPYLPGDERVMICQLYPELATRRTPAEARIAAVKARIRRLHADAVRCRTRGLTDRAQRLFEEEARILWEWPEVTEC